jgi:hypothetical protein
MNMMKLVIVAATLAIPVGVLSQAARAEHTVAHTHIGVNPTLRPDWSDPGNRALDTDSDPTDNDKLWFFSVPPVHVAATPGWPDWSQADGSPFLLLSPIEGPGGTPLLNPSDPSEQLYISDFMWSKAGGYGDPLGYDHLDGWHSAHGPGGMWSLESVDDQTVPGWDLHLKRESTSVAEDEFFMSLPSGIDVLTADGDTYQLDKNWLDEKNAWGLHEHMRFYFWLAEDGSDIGSEVSATLSVFDAGGLYEASDPFTFRFEVVPEPASLSLISVAGLLLLKRRRSDTLV